MRIDSLFKNYERPYIIGEVSQNHDGSLGQAHAFIDMIADAGADAIKFQTHIAAEESTLLEPFRVAFSYEDKSRFDYWKRMEFTESQWKELYDHAQERNIDFLSSPFSMKAFEILEKIGIKAWKFGSGEVFNNKLLKAAIDTGKPLLLSTGLSTWDDIDRQMEKVKENGNDILLFQCVTAYPSEAKMINLNLIDEMSQRYNCPIGISDHSATVFPALAAIARGAKAVEVHVTMSKYMFGPDVKASVDYNGLSEIVLGTQFISKMLFSKEDLKERDNNRENLRKLFSKSLYYRKELKNGHKIQENDLVAKKPNMGIDESQMDLFIGKQLFHDVKVDDMVRMEDFEK